MIFRFQIGIVRRLFVFNGFHSYSTTTKAVPAQPHGKPILVDYLVNTIGLSKEEALTATRRVRETSRDQLDLVISFLKELGLNKVQIRSMALKSPRILAYNVEKTIRPNVRELQELGMSGSDLTKALITYKLIFCKGILKTSIEYLRNLLGSDENVLKAVKRFGFVLDSHSTPVVESNVQLLLNQGFSKEFVARLLEDNPRCFVQNLEKFEEAIYMTENEFGIPRDSKMFYYGFMAAVSNSKETIHSKIQVLKSFGFPDLGITAMIKQHPSILGTSESKLRKVWKFFTTEVGCTPDFLVNHPNVFNLSFEKRILPRYQILKVLNEKQLKKKISGFYGILCLTEPAFMSRFILPYTHKIPDVVDSYFKVVGRKKSFKLSP